MNSTFKLNHIITMLMVLICFNAFSQIPPDSLKQLLCRKSWHLMKLTDVSGNGQNMGAELFNVDTKFNLDGTIETSSAGKETKDSWKLMDDMVSLETGQLKDPKSGQEKVKIVSISDTELKVEITYRGNNIMQFDYQ